MHARRGISVRCMARMTDCYSCARNAEFDRLPPRERVGGDDLWRVAHAFDTALPGWLVLLPRRHVTSIAELTDAEAVSLGMWQVRLSRALHAVLDCQKTYVAQFAEAEGFAHVHFHIVPRPVDLSGAMHGPGIFQLLGADDRPRVDAQAMDELAIKLSMQL
jgi:diadenosine tetraphosphate (Ap4A) HIT family hydrolase